MKYWNFIQKLAVGIQSSSTTLAVLAASALLTFGLAVLELGALDSNKALAGCAECTTACKTQARFDCTVGGHTCIDCGDHPGFGCREVGSGFLTGTVCRYCIGKCTYSTYGVEDRGFSQKVSEQWMGQATDTQTPEELKDGIAFRLEFSPADDTFVRLSQEFPTHAAALLAYWYDEQYRPISLLRESQAIYHASPELSELYTLRAVKHANNPARISALLDDPPSKEYQLALPMTVNLKTELFPLSDDDVGLLISSYDAADEQLLGQTLIIANETEREGHFSIGHVQSAEDLIIGSAENLELGINNQLLHGGD
ncbi:MAG: hypothetical protein HND55_03980 [Pseudomonadota bacterium]|nr:MAG: hypothetical protein HND55_03980 [Pseudomonadota bacterium]